MSNRQAPAAAVPSYFICQVEDSPYLIGVDRTATANNDDLVAVANNGSLKIEDYHEQEYVGVVEILECECK